MLNEREVKKISHTRSYSHAPLFQLPCVQSKFSLAGTKGERERGGHQEKTEEGLWLVGGERNSCRSRAVLINANHVPLYPIFNPLIIQPVNWHRGGRLVYINNPMARGIIQVNNPHLSFESAFLLLFLHYAPLHFYFILFYFIFFLLLHFACTFKPHQHALALSAALLSRAPLLCIMLCSMFSAPHTHKRARRT